MRRIFLIAFLLTNTSFVSAQLYPEQFELTVADFSPHSPLVTGETEAVVLLDSGSCIVDADRENGFHTVFHRFKRVLVLNPNALEDASLKIHFSAKLNGPKLQLFRACAYSLENGVIQKSEAGPENFLIDEESKENYRTESIAFPNVRVGSIYEFEYEVKINTTELKDWYFQGKHPTLKSIYSVAIPDGYNYLITFQNKKFLTSTRNATYVRQFHSASFDYPGVQVHQFIWTYEDIPAMRKEPFTSTLENYLASIKFQLSAYLLRPGISQSEIDTWEGLSDRLLEADNFGKSIEDPGALYRRQAKELVNPNDSKIQQAQAIYDYVRDNYRCQGPGVMIQSKSLANVVKQRSGNEGEINFVLMALLRTVDIQADPVILATRESGLTNQAYPVLDHYNYLVCRAVAGNQVFYLDASVPHLGFGHLQSSCYNGHSRVIAQPNFPVFLAPDSLIENTSIYADIRNIPAKMELVLHLTDSMGTDRALGCREELSGSKPDIWFKEQTKTTPLIKSLDSFYFTNLDNPDLPLSSHFTASLDPGTDDHLYFNPMLDFGLTENPFHAEKRDYPVELPYVIHHSYTISMEVPTGYEIEEMPKTERILLNDSDGVYEYRVERAKNQIIIQSRQFMNRAIFDPESYEAIRKFYAAMIRKQGELIVFRKLK